MNTLSIRKGLTQYVNALKKTILFAALLLLGTGIAKGQVSSAYTFTSVVGTYNTTLTDQRTVFPSGWAAMVANVPLPFTFYFNGKGYSSVWVNSNGYITFGETAPLASYTNPIANNNGFDGSVSGFGANNSGKSAAMVEADNLNPLVCGTQTSGGNTVFVIQWTKGYRQPLKILGGSDNISFQIRLVQNTNVVEIMFNATSVNNLNPANMYSPMVGLGGASVSDFNIRTKTATGAWTTANHTAGTTSGSYMTFNNNSMPAAGLTFIWTPVSAPTACTDVPAVPKAVASLGISCGANPVTVSLAGLPNVTGLTYQWQQSLTGLAGSFTNISAATDPTYSATPSQGSYYRCQVSCGASTVSSASVAVGRQTNCPAVPLYNENVWRNAEGQGAQYGTSLTNLIMPASTTTCGSAINDAAISASGYNLAFPVVAGNNINYLDATYLPPLRMQAGTAYHGGTMQAGFTNPMQGAIWIDFNDDGTFAAAEQVSTITNFINTSTSNLSIIIPAVGSGAYYGLHRMRVRTTYGVAVTSATALITGIGGNTRDYLVSIMPPDQSVAAAPIAAPASICAPGAVQTLTATPNIAAGTPPGTQYLYTWTGPSGFGTSVSSAANTTNFSPANTSFSGIYTVSPVVDGAQACMTGTTNVIVATSVSAPGAPPSSVITVEGNTYQGAGTITFTPFSVVPDGYLIVATNSAVAPTNPVDGTTYATGSTGGFGAGSVVVSGSVFASAPPYSTSGLNSNSAYRLYVYPFNIDCSGPKYYTGYPVLVNNTVTTCIAPPTGLGTSGATGTTVNLNWTAAAAGGNPSTVINPATYTYTIHAYMNAGLTTEAIGFPVTGVTGTSYTATGLSVGTQYYFVVTSTAPGATCGSNSNTATGTTICTGAAGTPLLQNFDNATLASLSPNCWQGNAGQVGTAGGVYMNGGNLGSPFFPHSGLQYYLFSGRSYFATGFDNQWLMSPGLALTPGTYNVRFWYSTNTNWAGLKVQYSTVGTLPAATAADMTSPTTIGSLTNINTGAWTLFSGTITISSAGTYYVGIDAITGAAVPVWNMAIDDFEICKVPVVNVTNSTAPYCATATVQLSSSGSSDANQFMWSGPSGFTSTLANPVVSGLGVGNYTYTLTAVSDPIASGYGGYCASAPNTTSFTVNPGPAAITGNAALCPGETLTLSNSTGSGTWTSTIPGIATVHPSSGLVTGVAAGTVTISYQAPCGGSVTTVITVNHAPGSITGGLVCHNLTSTMVNSIGGGTWSSADGGIATIGASTGTLFGVAPGTVNITYSFGSCRAYAVATVTPALPTITGNAPVCPTTTTTLSNATGSGTWSSSNGNATIGLSSGLVTGVTTGTAVMTYTQSVCYKTAVVTVVALPTAAPAINSMICLGGTAALTGNPSGTTNAFLWSGPGIGATTTANTTAMPSTTGTNTYSLTVSNTSISGCPTSTYTVSTVVDAPPIAVASNSGVICNGGVVTLTATPGGSTTNYTWNGPGLSSTNTAVTTATPSTSIAYTVTATNGTSAPGCSNDFTTSVTVNATPVAAPTNNGHICVGGTVTLAANPGGGANTFTWSGSALSATTGAGPTATPTTTGIYSLTVSDGTTRPGCAPSTVYTTEVTVNSTPIATPSNSGSICNGGTVTLNANPAGGASVFSWTGSALSSGSAQNPTATPTTTSIYSLTVTDGSGHSGCSPATVYTTEVTVDPKPVAAPSNDGYICNGGTVNLTANPSGGANTYAWTGSALSSGTAQDPTAAPTATTTYSLTVSDGSGRPGCAPTTVYTTEVTVHATPVAAPDNNGYICVGGTVTLSANPSGGANTYTWSGAALSSTVAEDPTADPTVTGVYSLTVSDGSARSGCAPTTVYTTEVTVNSTPIASPTNSGSICNGGIVTLNANPAGGATAYTWSGSSLATATDENPTATPSSTTVFSLTVSDGSSQPGCAPSTVYTTEVTVDPTPVAAPTNNGYICAGGTVSLTANPGGGANTFAWTGTSLSSGTDEDPTATPVVTDVYSLTVSDGTGRPGCAPATVYTTEVTVNATPIAAPVNDGYICNGGTVNLTATPGGGATTYAWVGASLSSTTAENPTATPSATTVYSLTVSDGSSQPGCAPATVYTTEVTVNANPTLSSASNDGPICEGTTLHLTANSPSDVTDYLWTGPGTLTGATTATAEVSGATVAASGVYTVVVNNGVGSGCTATYTTSATVNTVPTVASITPSTTDMCVGATLTLNAGAVTGSGTLVSYNWSGPNSYSATTSGTSTALIPSAVAASGSYSLTVTYNGIGCTSNGVSSAAVTVNPLPFVASTSISPSVICAGGVLTLTATGAVGVGTLTSYNWSGPNGYSSTSAGASQTYTIPGVLAAGAYSLSVTYTGTGCTSASVASSALTVNPAPDAGTLSGVATVCPAATTAFSSTTTGGVWSSGATGTATVDASGLVTGVAAGTATISYSYTNICGTAHATRVATVNPGPTAGVISGTAVVCPTTTTTLTSTVAGGTWTSTATGTATVGSNTGIVTGVASGTATISYAATNSCGTGYATQIVTVSPLPNAGTLSGTYTVCPGATTTLSSTSTGGTWSSSATGTATVGSSTGIVTGVAAGTADITYTVTSICGEIARAVTNVTVNSLANAGTVTGTAQVCQGATVTLANSVSGGTWSSSSANATVNTSGVVTGVGVGTATISYSVTNICGIVAATMVVTVNMTNIPVITLTADPGTDIAAGTTVTFTATVANAGTSPVYEWYRNSAMITSATTNTFITSLLVDGDVITVKEHGIGECDQTSSKALTIKVRTGLSSVSNASLDVRVAPNPNKGEFTIKGSIGTTLDEKVSIDVTDILGRSVFAGNATAKAGTFNQVVTLDKTLANGTYLLNVRTASGGSKVFHVVVEK